MSEIEFTGRVGGTEGLPGNFQRSEGPACKSKKMGQARGEPSSEAYYRALLSLTLYVVLKRSGVSNYIHMGTDSLI